MLVVSGWVCVPSMYCPAPVSPEGVTLSTTPKEEEEAAAAGE